MSNHKLNILRVECQCPYCDGVNVIRRAQSVYSELDLTNREIACKYCRSLFTMSETKLRIRKLSKQEVGAA